MRCPVAVAAAYALAVLACAKLPAAAAWPVPSAAQCPPHRNAAAARGGGRRPSLVRPTEDRQRAVGNADIEFMQLALDQARLRKVPTRVLPGAASLTDCLSLTSSFRSQAKLAASEGEVPVRPVVCRCTPHPLLGGVARLCGTRGVVDRNVAAIPTSDMTATVPLLLQVGAVLISQTGEVIATGR